MSNMYNNSKKEPTISVIIPVFDAQETIERCVQSLQKQTYGKLEFLFIDDGSTDATSEIIKRHQVSDNRIRYYYQSNNGVSSARNYGLELAQGEYIGFCDADDWVDEDIYELLVNNILENNADISIVQLYYERDNGIREMPFGNDNRLYVMSPSETACEMNKGKLFLGHIWNKLFSRKVLQGITFAKNIYMCEDALFVHLALSNANTIVFQNTCKYHYVEMSNSLSSRRGNVKYLTRREAYLQIEQVCLKEGFRKALPYVYNNIIEGDLLIAQTVALDSKLNRDYYFEIKKEIKKYTDEIRCLSKSNMNSVSHVSLLKTLFFINRHVFCSYVKLIHKRQGD